MSGAFFVHRGLLLFWALWFSLVCFTNLCDGLRAWGRARPLWRFASSNYAQVVQATSVYRARRGLANVLFAAATVWQGVAATLMWWALYASWTDGVLAWSRIYAAFAAALIFCAALILADETFKQYEKEAAHHALFATQLLTFMALHVQAAR